MFDYSDIVSIAESWPGVSAENWYGTPGLKVGGKGFARMWSDREYNRDAVADTKVLVVMCDLEEKPHLIESSGGVAFETPHYFGSGAMLVRLAEVGHDDLVGFLEDSYLCKASPKLRAEFTTL